MKLLSGISLAVLLALILLAWDFATGGKRVSAAGPTTDKAPTRSKGRPAPSASSRAEKLSSEDLLALAYDAYPELQFDFDINELPEISPLTEFRDWVSLNYPDGLPLIPNDFATTDLRRNTATPEQIAEANAFLNEHSELFEQLERLATQSVVLTRDQFQVGPSTSSSLIIRASLLAKFRHEFWADTNNAKNSPPSLAFSNQAQLLAEHLTPNFMGHTLRIGLQSVAFEELHVTPTEPLGDFQDRVDSLIETAKGEIVFWSQSIAGDSDFVTLDRKSMMLTFSASMDALRIQLIEDSKDGRLPSSATLQGLHSSILARSSLDEEEKDWLATNIVELIVRKQAELEIKIDRARIVGAFHRAASDGVKANSINDLVPAYLTTAPIHRQSGKPLEFDRRTGEIVLPE